MSRQGHRERSMNAAAQFRAQDLRGADARLHCCIGASRAAYAIEHAEAMLEHDLIAILHALQLRIERGGNMHLETWRDAAETLGELQASFAASARAEEEWHVPY